MPNVSIAFDITAIELYHWKCVSEVNIIDWCRYTLSSEESEMKDEAHITIQLVTGQPYVLEIILYILVAAPCRL